VNALPDWVQSHALETRPPADLAHRHEGEQQAILTALDIGSDLLLVDERAARRAAEALNLRVAGTLGTLVTAGWEGLLDFDEALSRLRDTSFHATDELLTRIRARYADGPPPSNSQLAGNTR